MGRRRPDSPKTPPKKVAADASWYKKFRAQAYAKHDEFKKLNIESKAHRLTEQEWLRTCNHFGGCAFCGGRDIVSKEYFIAFKDGGRYIYGNIIPLCEKCAGMSRQRPNPFLYLDYRCSNVRDKIRFGGFAYCNKQTLPNLVAYLKPILEAGNEKQEE